MESRSGIEPVVEWPRVVFVWGVLAAELLAFGWLARELANTPSVAERAVLSAVGLGVGVALSLTIRPHGPDELNGPGRVALVLGVAGAVITILSGVRVILGRFRSGTG